MDVIQTRTLNYTITYHTAYLYRFISSKRCVRQITTASGVRRKYCIYSLTAFFEQSSNSQKPHSPTYKFKVFHRYIVYLCRQTQLHGVLLDSCTLRNKIEQAIMSKWKCNYIIMSSYMIYFIFKKHLSDRCIQKFKWIIHQLGLNALFVSTTQQQLSAVATNVLK